MSSTIRLAAALLAVTGAAVAAVQSAAAQQATCDWYAKTALRQQQENEQRKCGFTGPGWSSDMKAHMAWCGVNSPDNWKSEAQRREQQLTTCKK
jgi:hypothetical protein